MNPRWAGAAFAAALCAFLVGLPVTAHASAGHQSRPPVVVLAVPGLQWSDVANMPTLQRFLAGAAVGELSVKTSGGTTRCAAGVLALSAGNRTEADNGNCRIPSANWAYLTAKNTHSKYRATIGQLGTALRQAGISTIAVGVDARSLIADGRGAVSSVMASAAAAMAQAARAPNGAVVAAIDEHLYYVPDGSGRYRASRAALTDRWLAATLSAIPAKATVMVVGISDIAAGHSHLHLFAVKGPGWVHTELHTSKATPTPFVQLIDVAPTILAVERVPVPSTMVGRPMLQSGASVAAYSKYVDDDRHAFGQRTLGQRTFLLLGIAVIVLMLLILLPGRALGIGGRWLARILAPAPALVFVMNALPWWRWGQPVFAVLVVAGAVVVAAATTVAGRRSPAAGIALPLAVTLTALLVDQLTGAHLQFSAPLGDSPIVAGRFRGVGNLDFSVIATSALLLAGVVAGWVGGRRGVVAAAAIVGVALVIDGAPMLGDDLGGVFSLLPGAVVLVGLLAGAKLTWRRGLLTAGTTVAVAVLVALADYSRPATSQTHVGRFVGQILHGGASAEVHRKLDAALATFGPTVGTFVAAVAIVTAIAGRRRLAGAVRRVPGLQAGAVAATVTALLGVALNDSGITIAAMATIVGLSAVYGAIGGDVDRSSTQSAQGVAA